MSLEVIHSRFLAIKPRIRIYPEKLTAQTNFLPRLFSLFSYCKTVEIDRNRKIVLIRRKIFWGFSREQMIPFDKIKRIRYSFDSIPTAWGTFYGRADQLEKFSISLCLTSPDEEVKLFSFSGEGAVLTGWSGVLLGGDNEIDYSGDQEVSSRDFVELVMKYTGKGL